MGGIAGDKNVCETEMGASQSEGTLKMARDSLFPPCHPKRGFRKRRAAQTPSDNCRSQAHQLGAQAFPRVEIKPPGGPQLVVHLYIYQGSISDTKLLTHSPNLGRSMNLFPYID